MSLLGIRDLTVAFDDVPLLDSVCLSAERGERICLVGRNGTGKTTLFKTIVGDFTSYSGDIARERGAVYSYLPQEVPADLSGLVFDVVAGGHKVAGKLLAEYHSVSMQIAHEKNHSMLDRLSEIQHELELSGGWNMTREVDLVISHMNLNPDLKCEDLSAGVKRRVLLARALVSKPDLLLLDEPTNHLDIDTIEWLEVYLREFKGAIFFITHDRTFSKKLATRIVEIDRGKLTSWTGDFDAYSIRKAAELEAEEKQRAKFDKKLAEEEAWLRKGVRARRTRNEGRVNDLLKLREEKQNQRQRIGSIHLEAEEAERSGRLVIEASGVDFSYGEKKIVSKFSTTIMRGDKIGIIGPNGSGKTTLLRILLGELKLKSGDVRFGTNLQIAYFDQLRSQISEDKSVQDNICDGNPFFMVGGRKRHVIGYLEDFLFTPDRAKSPVSVLSGGERNRLMLAKLFTMPSNVLVLDEPTNDLDSDTLDLLEEMLLQYPGTVLLVSHDREFLNNVVTSTIAFEGNGLVEEFVGGYDDWVRQRKIAAPVVENKIEEQAKVKKIKTDGPRKLSFKEKNELSELPSRIDALEKEKEELFHSMADSKVYESSGGVAAATSRIAEIESELKAAYDRWAELEERKDI